MSSAVMERPAVVAPYAERDAPGPEATDHVLVAAVRRGDDRAFELLFARYQRRIAAYVAGMVADHGRAEDITQEIFISALRRMRETERPIAFKPWVYEIAKNACIDQFRRSRRTEEISYDADEGMGAADYGRLAERGPSPDAAVVQKQALEHLCGAFGGLSETHHQILVLREFEGLSYREIGDRLGMTRPSVESTLFRARRRLTEEYDELASGERCLRVQALLGTAAGGLLGARDERRLSRHLSHCDGCRREARVAGVDAAVMARRPPRRSLVPAKIAGLLPFPAFLRGRRGGESAEGVLPGHGFVSHWSAALGAAPEPLLTGWSKAAAAAATLVLAGVGAEVGTRVAQAPAAGGGARSAMLGPAASRQPAPPARSASSRVAAVAPAAAGSSAAPGAGLARRRSLEPRQAGAGGLPVAPRRPAPLVVPPATQPPVSGAPEAGTGTGEDDGGTVTPLAGAPSVTVDAVTPPGNAPSQGAGTLPTEREDAPSTEHGAIPLPPVPTDDGPAPDGPAGSPAAPPLPDEVAAAIEQLESVLAGATG